MDRFICPISKVYLKHHVAVRVHKSLHSYCFFSSDLKFTNQKDLTGYPMERILINLCEDSDLEEQVYSPITRNRPPSSPAYSLSSPKHCTNSSSYGVKSCELKWSEEEEEEEEKKEEEVDRAEQPSSPEYRPHTPDYSPTSPGYFPGDDEDDLRNGGDEERSEKKKEKRKKRMEVDPSLCISSARERKRPNYFVAS